MPIWRPDEPHYPGQPYPPCITRAQGSYLYTADGQAIWDGTCAWWVTVHGHCHPVIAEAIAQAAYTLDQVLFADLTHPAAETLTEKLTARTGLPYAFSQMTAPPPWKSPSKSPSSTFATRASAAPPL